MGLFDIFKISSFKDNIKNLENELESTKANLEEKSSSLNVAENELKELKLHQNELGIDELIDLKLLKEKLENSIIEEEKNVESEKIKIQSSFDSFKFKMTESKNKLQQEIEGLNLDINQLNINISNTAQDFEKIEKKIISSKKKLSKYNELYKSTLASVKGYLNGDEFIPLPSDTVSELDKIAPTVELKINSLNVKDLRAAFRDNKKQIEEVLKHYQGRYTTKANRTIYDLMVLSLESELQNILIDLKYEKQEDAIENIKSVCRRHLEIANAGNQQLLSTIEKFIAQIEYLFVNAVKIEYMYHIRKEQARQEQLELRQKLREESEERKSLEEEKKKVMREEEKFKTEITKIADAISNSSDQTQIDILNKRILELESNLSEVLLKKEEISNLQNGKAGYVYIISNIGSFGENVFKVGMTRRVDPQDRVNELGSASVPFRFDVHSFIFSKDAVSLESKIHDILNDKRINKVNMRKEYFYTNLEELENIVQSIDPTAEFNKSILAEEFNMSNVISDNLSN